jgi:hypothetical protein
LREQRDEETEVEATVKSYLLVGLFVLILLLAALGIEWFIAGVRARAWQREGADITQWEVFWGTIPIDRKFINGEKQ